MTGWLVFLDDLSVEISSNSVVIQLLLDGHKRVSAKQSNPITPNNSVANDDCEAIK